ncbi:hypothetical protein C7412_10911 [Paraburkholderia silvatlantica]|nr:hypothetical protein C7412_10911 [Paraburkholderia silvatlantica]
MKMVGSIKCTMGMRVIIQIEAAGFLGQIGGREVDGVGQYTGNTVSYLDSVTIGSRYTVRGFDGETLLAGSRGFYWRNELQVPVAQTGLSAYAGLDYGRVWGPEPVALVGTQLAGAVIGVKGSVMTRFGGYGYDLFAGTPVYKPSGFPTARVTVGFQLTAQF